MRMKRRTFVKSSLAAAASSVTSRFPMPRVESKTLRAAAKKNLLAGSAVSHSQLKSASVTPILAEQCNILVAENEMKWCATQPERERYDFAAADDLMAFAERNDMHVRGHNLWWHQDQPPWFTDLVTRENASAILKEHIHNVAGRYAGRIQSWDVVNEAIDPAGGRKDGMRDSLWMQLLGLRYIAISKTLRVCARAEGRAVHVYLQLGS